MRIKLLLNKKILNDAKKANNADSSIVEEKEDLLIVDSENILKGLKLRTRRINILVTFIPTNDSDRMKFYKACMKADLIFATNIQQFSFLKYKFPKKEVWHFPTIDTHFEVELVRIKVTKELKEYVNKLNAKNVEEYFDINEVISKWFDKKGEIVWNTNDPFVNLNLNLPCLYRFIKENKIKSVFGYPQLNELNKQVVPTVSKYSDLPKLLVSKSTKLVDMANGWDALFSSISSGTGEGEKGSGMYNSSTKYLIHMGSGPGYREGWLNIDYYDLDSAKGDFKTKVDMFMPMQLLDLPSNSASMYESFHTIEHIYRWQVKYVYSEIFRVLDWGGQVALECPNLSKVARNYLKEPNNYQMGMWGFYGDPSHKESVIVHRWGYSFKSMSEDMSNRGFHHIVEEVPHSHVPHRDLRVVSIKDIDNFRSANLLNRIRNRIEKILP